MFCWILSFYTAILLCLCHSRGNPQIIKHIYSKKSKMTEFCSYLLVHQLNSSQWMSHLYAGIREKSFSLCVHLCACASVHVHGWPNIHNWDFSLWLSAVVMPTGHFTFVPLQFCLEMETAWRCFAQHSRMHQSLVLRPHPYLVALKGWCCFFVE